MAATVTNEYDEADLRFWQEHAPFYDLYSTGQDSDVAFYVEEAKRTGSPVLEIGCGTGRVLMPVAQAGVSIIGLDRSEAMLSIARHKVAQLLPEVRQRIHLFAGDMRHLSLEKRFGLVMVPYRGFHHLYTPEDQRQALVGIRDHLVDGGRFVFDTLDPRLDILAENFHRSDVEMVLSDELVHPQTGERILVWNWSDFDAELQMIEQELLFETVDEAGETIAESHQHFAVRYTYRYEMQYLLEQCGFQIDNLYGDFQRGPFRSGGQQVWVARKR